jgi:hypothetical protein
MSCNADHYRYAIACFGKWFSEFEGWLEQITGHEYLAYLALGAIIAPVTYIFVWSQYILVPKFVKWYYDETIIGKGKKWFKEQGLGPMGFKHSTAIISVLAGAVFYALFRAAAAFPAYILYTGPSLVMLFIGIAVLGFFVSGKVPNNDRARNRYFKRFYSPTVTGLGLAIGTLLLDFIISVLSLVMTQLQTI